MVSLGSRESEAPIVPGNHCWKAYPFLLCIRGGKIFAGSHSRPCGDMERNLGRRRGASDRCIGASLLRNPLLTRRRKRAWFGGGRRESCSHSVCAAICILQSSQS
ncbi:hypothetical protein N658DRAFT_242075 [Parathielavia hyrcaniae]|uniref:Uncharacterized protein n=1 Tax=Parathielavia hyrcaniae TaxID=113614 RepID=A0AAN6Q712_9PEZI|nr:hypothetical protein N658DRAFT_242075 [Parathielavia hyrcaniae]